MEWCKRFTATQAEVLDGLIEDLGLVPSCLISPELLHLLNLYIYEKEKELDDFQKDVRDEFLLDYAKRCRARKNFKTPYPDIVVQTLNFD